MRRSVAVSMDDVARLAGVSQRTVSNVVNDYVHVKQETRQRVQRAIDELKYRPNPSARNLRGGRTGLVALAVPEIAAPYFAQLADSIQRRAAERGVTLLVDQTGGVRDRELLVLEGYRSNVIDGLILHPLSVSAEDLSHRELDFPTVLLGESVAAGDIIHVSIHNVAAARLATDHLIQQGRTRIAAVGAVSDLHAMGPAMRRTQGYVESLSRAGLGEVRDLTTQVTGWNRGEGYRVAAAIVEERADVDALFCFNDLLALGAIKALQDRGVRIPDDLAIVGWDDLDECLFSTPTLSTIAPDKGSIARSAVDALLDRLAGTIVEETEIMADFALIVRESSAV